METTSGTTPFVAEHDITSEDEEQKSRRVRTAATKKLTEALHETEGWRTEMLDGMKDYCESKVEGLEKATARAKRAGAKPELIAKADQRIAQIWSMVYDSE